MEIQETGQITRKEQRLFDGRSLCINSFNMCISLQLSEQTKLKYNRNNLIPGDTPQLSGKSILGNAAESRRKVVRSRLCFFRPMTRKLRQPSIKWVPFSNQGRLKQRKKKEWLISCAQDTVGL